MMVRRTISPCGRARKVLAESINKVLGDETLGQHTLCTFQGGVKLFWHADDSIDLFRGVCSGKMLQKKYTLILWNGKRELPK